MAIGVRGTVLGPNVNASSTSISLPAGMTAGDLSIITFVQACVNYATNTFPVLTPPSGWTVLCNGGGNLVCYRVFVAGDATSGIAVSSNRSDWWESGCVVYTGVDTSHPIDASNFFYAYDGADTSTQHQKYRAPSLNPNYNGSQLLCIYQSGYITGSTLALPGGMTSRVNTAAGPNLRMCDKTLTDGTPTGDISSSLAAGNVRYVNFGMQIAVKASGASAATLAAARAGIVGLYQDSGGLSSFTVPLDRLNVQDKDLVVVLFNGANTVSSAPSGYNQQSNIASAMFYTHQWRTGDSKTPSFTMSSNGIKTIYVILIRKAGVSVADLVLDSYAVTTASGNNSVSVTSSSLARASSDELLLVFFGTSGTTNPGTFSGVTGGLTNEYTESGPSSWVGWLDPASNPAGAMSGTCTVAGTNTLGVVVALFGMVVANLNKALVRMMM